MTEDKRALQAARRAERAALLKAREDAWQAKVERHFGYLQTEYGFRITNVDASSVWVTRLIYELPVLAIRIDRSFEFDRVELLLVRLVDGEMPQYPIFVTPEITLHHYWFDTLLEVRAPTITDDVRTLTGLNDEKVERSLEFLARALEEYASDVLRGDLTIFTTLEELIKERARQNPPKIVIHVPESTSPESAQHTLQDVQQSNPGIPVEVQTYQARKSKRRPRKPSSDDAPQGNT